MGREGDAGFGRKERAWLDERVGALRQLAASALRRPDRMLWDDEFGERVSREMGSLEFVLDRGDDCLIDALTGRLGGEAREWVEALEGQTCDRSIVGMREGDAAGVFSKVAGLLVVPVVFEHERPLAREIESGAAKAIEAAFREDATVPEDAMLHIEPRLFESADIDRPPGWRRRWLHRWVDLAQRRLVEGDERGLMHPPRWHAVEEESARRASLRFIVGVLICEDEDLREILDEGMAEGDLWCGRIERALRRRGEAVTAREPEGVRRALEVGRLLRQQRAAAVAIDRAKARAPLHTLSARPRRFSAGAPLHMDLFDEAGAHQGEFVWAVIPGVGREEILGELAELLVEKQVVPGRPQG